MKPQATLDKTEGEDVNYVTYDLNQDVIDSINEARKVFETFPDLKAVQLNGASLFRRVQEWSTINTMTEFQSDVQEITISKSGRVQFRALNKWDYKAYYEFEINI